MSMVGEGAVEGEKERWKDRRTGRKKDKRHIGEKLNAERLKRCKNKETVF